MSDPTLLPIAVATLEQAKAAVRDSPHPLGLLDMPAATLIVMSERARQLVGLGEGRPSIDAGSLVSDEPRATGHALALVLDHSIDGYQGRRRLRTQDGTAIDCTFALRAIEVDGVRRFAIVSFMSARISPSRGDEVVDAGSTDEVNDAASRPSPARLAQLELHLQRIAHEIEAAGVISTVARVPALSSVPGLSDLSPRQHEVISRLLRGDRVSTIARAMFLSPSTVRNHLAAIYRKVGVKSQAELLEMLHSATEGR